MSTQWCCRFQKCSLGFISRLYQSIQFTGTQL